MRFTTITIALLGAAASASASALYRRQYPDCTASCFAAADFGTCEMSDAACLCASPTFVASTTACFRTECQGEDLENALLVSRTVCEQVGVTLTEPEPTGGEGEPGTSPDPTDDTAPGPASSGGPVVSGGASNTESSGGPRPTNPGAGAGSSAITHGVNGFVAVAALGFSLML
ncbi:hypothetical protein FA15DRAFT_665480 [Coprinopsis marcescibilis]|uniref:CFEM domain-containing protein n=1 Tax=Coprinopsis marcescibilis TaxID=230819 RepID=A0A5C3L690_COPMA|nr:hypothetical protein FA15DRAFT_665480 [Coprinopsis marcescibilis]